MGPVLFIIVALLGGLGWLAYEHGYFHGRKKSHSAATLTNAPAAHIPLINTQLIVRVMPSNIATTNTSVSPKSAAVLDAQIALDRLGISCGSIDGILGL